MNKSLVEKVKSLEEKYTQSCTALEGIKSKLEEAKKEISNLHTVTGSLGAQLSAAAETIENVNTYFN